MCVVYVLENKIIKKKKKMEGKEEERYAPGKPARAGREKFQSSGLIKESDECGIEIVRIVVSLVTFLQARLCLCAFPFCV